MDSEVFPSCCAISSVVACRNRFYGLLSIANRNVVGGLFDTVTTGDPTIDQP
jgi:hypothetical protein